LKIDKNEKRLFSFDDLFKMLEMQSELNKKYSGEKWYEKIPDWKIKTAVFTETAEMFEELSHEWKWWKNKEFDKAKAIEEAVDILHFDLSLLLKYAGGNMETVKEWLKIYKEKTDMEILLETYEEHLNNFSFEMFDKIFEMTRDKLFNKLPKGEKENFAVFGNFLNAFLVFYYYICELFEIDAFVLVDAYMFKNQKNHKRVEGGYKEGKYDKSQEETYKLEQA